MIGINFHKIISPDFDRIDVQASSNTDWLTITMDVGLGVGHAEIIIRNHESVRDLHYALGRYIELLEKNQ